MEGVPQNIPGTIEDVFRDFRGRRTGMIKALTTEVEKFYQQCHPDKENLWLQSHPNETWEVDLPNEEVPPEIPEPTLGINFARDGMQDNEWLSLVAAHSDAWLLSVAFYFAARFGFDNSGRLKSICYNCGHWIMSGSVSRLKQHLATGIDVKDFLNNPKVTVMMMDTNIRLTMRSGLQRTQHMLAVPVSLANQWDLGHRGRHEVGGSSGVAYYLNPKYQYKHALGTRVDLLKSLQDVIKKLESSGSQEANALREVSLFLIRFYGSTAPLRRLFEMINDLPTVFEVVAGGIKKQPKEKSTASPNRSSKSKSSGKMQPRQSESQTKVLKMLPPPRVEDASREDEDNEQEATLCGACGNNYADDEFWICCDVCERWFHGKCVKITPSMAEHIKQYKCPACSNKRARA
ncbi:hypothetical protein HHK36_004603 [Tetracentron sinense]|uniref:PHD finger protein ALFIN-LIKE n=1 Tax=Tetracentron sinense TaxID=13715 RepID=A0A834ZVJ5_TETSI|nr:hypothetical protein HHK36_004603 [Tetracentron sinense]